MKIRNFSRSLKKPVSRENWENYVFTFQFLNDEIDQNTNFVKCQMAFFGSITVNSITQKLKSKRLVYLSFLWFLKEQEKIFYTFSRIPIFLA